jgi:hypothetical protein
MGSPSGQVLGGAGTVVEGEGAIDVAVVVLAVVPVGAGGLQATITRPKIVADLRRSMGWTTEYRSKTLWVLAVTRNFSNLTSRT